MDISEICVSIERLTSPSDAPERIRRLEYVLRNIQREDDPYQWANAYWKLGDSYEVNPHGDPAENIERALHAYQTALAVFTQREFPKEWANLYAMIANLTLRRHRGRRDENVGTAILLCQTVVAALTPTLYRKELALANTVLGYAYVTRQEGERQDNLEHAIVAYEAALGAMINDLGAKQWASLRFQLAHTYWERSRGERAENIERTVQLLEGIVTEVGKEEHPDLWAEAQDQLSRYYKARPIGEFHENISRAIGAGEAALTVFDRKRYPKERARTLNNLGSSYGAASAAGLIRQGWAKAIWALEEALTIRPREVYPRGWALTQANLGSTLLSAEKEQGDEKRKTCSLSKVFEAYEKAFTVFTRDVYPVDWASLQMKLAEAYRFRAEATDGDPADDYEKASTAFQLALTIFTAGAYPEYAVYTGYTVAQFLMRRERWQEAYEALRTALSAAETLFNESITERGKKSELSLGSSIYSSMVEVLLRVRPPRLVDAFLVAEQSRSRLLLNQIGVLPLPAPKTLPPELLEEETKLLNSVRQQEILAREDAGGALERKQFDLAEDTRTRLHTLWDEFTQDYGAIDYVALRRGERVNWEEVQNWLTQQRREVAILEFFTFPDRLIIFIVRKGLLEPFIVTVEIGEGQLERCLEQLEREVHHHDSQIPLKESWQNSITQLPGKLMPHLTGAELVYVIPHGNTHHLPLHALNYQGKPILEHFPMVYAPSVAVAMRATPRVDVAVRQNILVVGNPSGDLTAAEEEAKSVAQRFHTSPLLREHATKVTVMAKLLAATHAHLATHAYFSADDPFGSGVELAQGQVLTARDIMKHTFRVQSLVLSACQTGRQSVSVGDELAGLARAFLYAGIPSLVLSQWSVNDVSTTKLMFRFYDHLYDDKGHKKIATVDALRLAMLEMRKEHPATYHWAPFMLYGDWH